MGLVIDTNFFIDIENQRITREKLEEFVMYGEAFIAAITAAELLAGIHLAADVSVSLKRSAFVEYILENMPILVFDEKVARTYAELYAYFIKPRNKSGANVHDLQIAATALAYGFPLLSNNRQDFEKVPGLSLLSL